MTSGHSNFRRAMRTMEHNASPEDGAAQDVIRRPPVTDGRFAGLFDGAPAG